MARTNTTDGARHDGLHAHDEHAGRREIRMRMEVQSRIRRLIATGLSLVATGAALIATPMALGLMGNAWLVRTVPSPVDVDERMLQAAAAYDRRLLDDGNAAIGEAGTDPFTHGGEANAPAYASDADYQSQLGDDDAMARILIPSISVDLPIGHGASPTLLETQAGHVYGTTLPVGDEGNSVIAAHRGLGLRMLFRRLGELGPGDMVYTKAAGAMVSWRVESSWTVNPDSPEERHAVAMERGTRWLTLYTCDPPGLNTRRLIVRAIRDDAPNATPPAAPTALTADPHRTMATLLVITAVAAAATLAFTPRRHRGRRNVTSLPPAGMAPASD